MKKFFYYISHPLNTIKKIRTRNLYSSRYKSLSDEDYLKRMFKIKMGYELNLQDPRTFNEKINWLKLYNRNPLYTTMVDKHAVKAYVSNIIGESHVIKELGVYGSSSEINLSLLPDKFVLKTNHGCGSMVICKNKDNVNWDFEFCKLDEALSDNYYFHCREWVYKDVKPCILAEEYMKDSEYDVLPVYKIFCFDGSPFLIQTIKNDKQINESIDYFDINWKRLKLKQNFPNSKHPLSKPSNLQEMLDLARKLTKGIPFVRCDFYSIEGKVFFSEFTFYSDAGFERFHPKKWDFILGDLIKLQSYR